MKYLLLFSYALLPKSGYLSKEVRFNETLDKNYSLTGLSIIETYSGSLVYKDGDINKVIILGCRTFGSNTPSDSELMGRYLEKLGVPNNKIIIDSNGTNTAYQVSRAKEIIEQISKPTEIVGITLGCHTTRTQKLLSAYGIGAEVLSAEDILEQKNSKIPNDIERLIGQFENSPTKRNLIFESKILEFMQLFDPKGNIQKTITNLRGIRYFDVDIPSTIAKVKKK